MAERQTIDISTASVFRALLVVFMFFLVYQLSSVLIVVLFAIVIASAVSPFVTWFEKRRVPRLIGVLLLYLMVVALVVILSTLVLPSVSSDVSNLNTYLPKLAEQLSSSLDKVQKGAPKYFDFVIAYEEPTLSHNFGETYIKYLHTVPRWLPRRPRA